MMGFQLGKIRVEVEPSFLLICVFLGVLLAMPGGDQSSAISQALERSASSWTKILSAGVFSLGVFVILAVHELGHALALRLFGYSVVKVAFRGMGQTSCATQRPVEPAHAWKVALMGPVANVAVGLFLMVLGFIFAGAPSAPTPSTADIPLHGALLMEIGLYCLGFGALGLIPIPPMDAGDAIARALPKEKHELFFTGASVASFAIAAACLGAQAFLGAVIFAFLGISNWSLRKAAAEVLQQHHGMDSAQQQPMGEVIFESQRLMQLTVEGWWALRAGNVQEAVRLANQCLMAANAQSLPPQLAVGAYDLLAWAALAEAEPQRAMNYLAKGAAKSGGMFRPLTKAMALDALGQKEAALEFALKAAQSEPTQTSGKLTFKLLAATGDVEGAMDFAEKFPWPKDMDIGALMVTLTDDQVEGDFPMDEKP